MGEFTSGLLDFGYFEVRHLIHYAAEPAALFRALTEGISAWWGVPYLVRADAVGMVLEPQLGGRMFEAWPHGGALWGVVNEVAQDAMLSFLLKVYGNVGVEQQHEFDEAWLDLLGERLKAYVERGERRGIGHERLPWQELHGLGPVEE
jgi:hypothetical protein